VGADVFAGEQLIDLGADSARARSGRGMRRFSIRDRSAVIHPCCIHQAAADLMASRETFHVDGDRAAHRAVNQAASRSGSMSGAKDPAVSAAGAAMPGPGQGGEVGVGGLAEGDLTGGRGYAADRPIPGRCQR
jgi:hypothetical protein